VSCWPAEAVPGRGAMDTERRSNGSLATAGERRLVSCPACHQQYDASGRSVGARFHCRCGELLTASGTPPHTAAVVRCSSCGGPREAGAQACGYCGADYTLHERDLHTICPECMARISDRARYCHRCATLIAPQGTAGEVTDEHCPACGEVSRLVSRSFGGERLSVLECGRCAGLWLGNAVFKHLEERAQRQSPSIDVGPPHGASRPAAMASGSADAARYRPCPVCQRLMHRRNHGRKSGVVVDTCQQHGLWFDQGELAAILGWVRQGGLVRARRWERQSLAEEERARRVRRDDRLSATWLERDLGSASSPLTSFVDGVLAYLSSR